MSFVCDQCEFNIVRDSLSEKWNLELNLEAANVKLIFLL